MRARSAAASQLATPPAARSGSATRASRRARAASRSPRRPRAPRASARRGPPRTTRISKLASTSAMARPLRTLSRSRCSSYSVSARSSVASMPSSASSAVGLGGAARRAATMRSISACDLRLRFRRRRRPRRVSSRPRHEIDGFVEQVERRRAGREPAHAQAVEDVLEVVREVADRPRSRTCPRALQRVRGAEQPVGELGIERGRRRARRRGRPDPRASRSRISSASETNSRVRLDCAPASGCDAPPRVGYSPRAFASSSRAVRRSAAGLEGLHEVGVGAELEAASRDRARSPPSR